MSIPNSIPNVNVDFADKKHIVSAASHAMDVMCTSVNINKWGLYRGYYAAATAALRLVRMQSSSFPVFGYESGDWRYYFHYQSAPGWDTDEAGFLDAAGSLDIGFVSLGTYTFAVQEWVDPDWVDDPAWISITGVNPADPNHYNHDLVTGELLGGADVLGVVYHNALLGEVRVTLTENVGAAREGRIIISHPDDADGDARTATLSVKQGGLIFYVDPLYVSFEHDEHGTKRTTINVGAGYNFTITWPDAQPAWLTATVTGSGTASGYVDFSCQLNSGAERSATMRVNKRDGTSIIGYKEVLITQQMAPL